MIKDAWLDTRCVTESKVRKSATIVLLCLTLLGMAAQVLPFVFSRGPTAQAIATVNLPSNYPPDYTPTDFDKANTFDQARFWGDALNTAATLLALVTLLVSGIPERVGAVVAPKARAWLVRVLFLVAVCLFLRGVDLPFVYSRFQHYKAFGLTALPDSAWWKLYVLGLFVPLALFVLKYLMVICTLPLCKQSWWLAATFGFFLISHVVPEVVSRTYPLDPVEKLEPLASGPHRDSMKAMLHQAGLDLPIMVVDESRRSRTASIGLTGRAGREYVLLTDTFVQQYTPQQAALALAHELGHFQRRTLSLLVQKSCALLTLMFSFGLVFMLSRKRALPISTAPRIVVLTLLCSLLVSHVFAPVSLAISRREERLADRYALQLAGDGEEYQRLLVKVAQQEFAPLDMPPLRYYLYASHPTFLERIAQSRKK